VEGGLRALGNKESMLLSLVSPRVFLFSSSCGRAIVCPYIGRWLANHVQLIPSKLRGRLTLFICTTCHRRKHDLIRIPSRVYANKTGPAETHTQTSGARKQINDSRMCIHTWKAQDYSSSPIVAAIELTIIRLHGVRSMWCSKFN
jgi:hypothetical protein